MDDLLTTRQIAAYLQVSTETIRRWVKENKIPCHRMGSRFIRFRKEEVDKALKTRVP